MKTALVFIFLSLLLIQCSDDRASDCSTPAVLKDLTGLDGCGFVFELEDGTRLEPIISFLRCGTPPLPKEITEDPLYGFEFVDGKRVRISYTIEEYATYCMAGPVVKITCIDEVAIFPTND